SCVVHSGSRAISAPSMGEHTVRVPACKPLTSSPNGVNKSSIFIPSPELHIRFAFQAHHYNRQAATAPVLAGVVSLPTIASLMPNSSVTAFNAEQTAQLLDFPGLLDALAIATVEYVNGAIHAPERQALPFPQGGVMLSMPATAHDIGIHKLVNVVPGNRVRDLPTI